jgi:hypothetical protein
MKTAIMQPYFFPYLGYYQLLKAADKFIFYDDVQYIQRGYINKNYIISKEGKIAITIPIKKQSVNTNIQDTIVQNSDWKNKMLNSLFYTYKKAPFYEQIIKLIERVLEQKSNYLVDYAINSVKIIANYLSIETEILRSSQIEYEKSQDKVGKLNSIVKNTNASCLILPPGSLELYSKESFNVSTNFLIPNKDIHYKQFSKNKFTPNLSMIDVLMFNDKSVVLEFLSKYKLK